MIYQIMTAVVLVLAGLWAALRVTAVGFAMVSGILILGLGSWALLAGSNAESLVVGIGFWLLFNVTYVLGGIGSSALGGRLSHFRSRRIAMRNAKSH
jgi:hypothetical protein